MKTRPSLELVDCAEALRKLNLFVPKDVIERLIAEGYCHLEELKALPKCNPLLISSLDLRLKRAEDLLEQKMKPEAVS